jgi:hypothetical protein
MNRAKGNDMGTTDDPLSLRDSLEAMNRVIEEHVDVARHHLVERRPLGR